MGPLVAQSGAMAAVIASIVTGNALPIARAQASPATTARQSGRISVRAGEKNVAAMDPPLLALIERLAQRDVALLLSGPVAAAGDGTVDHQIVAVDETGFVAGEKYRGVRDVLGQPGAQNRLRGLVDFASRRAFSPPPRPKGRAPCRRCRWRSRPAKCC